MDPVFLELDEHVGIAPSHLEERDADGAHLEHPNAGEPEPLASESVAYAVPVMVRNPQTGKDEVGSDIRVAKILPSDGKVTENAVVLPDNPDVAPDARVIPGTRTIETVSAHIVSLLDGNGYHQVEPPAGFRPSTQSAGPKKAELQKQAEALGLPTSGTKEDLAAAIAAAQAAAASGADADNHDNAEPATGSQED